jgi:microcystin-dependent protein
MSTSASLNYTYPMPIGCIIPYLGKNIPDSFLLCDGSTYNISDYPFLNNVLGGIYGSTATTFNVPNTVNKFIEPTSTNSNVIVPGSGGADFNFTLTEANMPLTLPMTGSITSFSGDVSTQVMTYLTSSTGSIGGSSTSATYIPVGGNTVSNPNYKIDLTGLSGSVYPGTATLQTVTSTGGVEPRNYSVFYIIKAKP